MLFLVNFLPSILLILLLIIIFQHIKNKDFYKKAALLPGPRTIPLIGNAHLLFGKKSNLLNKLYKMYDLYPSLFRLWIGNSLIITIYDPEKIEAVLKSSKICERPKYYKLFEHHVGKGIFTLSVPKWRLHRKLILPAIKNLHSCNEIFQKHAIMFLKIIDDKENGKEFNVAQYTSIYSMNIILERIMNETVNLGFDETQTHVAQFKSALNSMTYKILNSYFLFNFQISKNLTKDIDPVHKLIENMIHQKRKFFIESMNEKINDNKICKTKSFFDFLMKKSFLENQLTEQDVLEEVKTIIVAGSHTTAVVADFAMRLLASFPEVQEKVRQEIKEIFGDINLEDKLITNEELSKMDYLERVIKETMRLFPAGPTISRKVTEDFKIGEYTLPKGSNVIIPIFHIHRSKKLWSNPLKFNPDRFQLEEIAKRHKMTYLPFSSGPRNCIGYKFSTTSLKILLLTILQKHVLETDDTTPIENIKVKTNVILEPVKPIKIKMKKLNI